MTATQFTDDAFNKFCHDGHGTLIGNWLEELSIRDSTGIGRSVPKFGTKKAHSAAMAEDPHMQADDTFERIYGHRTYDVEGPTSAAIGAGDKEDVVRKPVAETLQADGRIATVGKRAKQEAVAMLEFATEEVQAEDDLEGEKRNERFFETSTGVVHTKPDLTQTSLPEFLKDSKKSELQRGPPPDRMRALRNKGLEVDGVTHYSYSGAVSHHSMAIADPKMQADTKLTVPTGYHVFGKNSEFSKPVGEFTKGTLKDQVLQGMLTMGDTLRMEDYGTYRKAGGGPQPPQATPVHSLAVLKEIVRQKLAEKWGAFGCVMLRKELSDKADHELLVPTADAKQVIRETLAISEEEVPKAALEVYMSQLATMRKDVCRVGDVLKSLRPILENADKAKVLSAYMALPKEPTLADWIGRVGVPEVVQVLLMAFDVSEDTANTVPVLERVFVEFYSDLAPFFEDLSVALPQSSA